MTAEERHERITSIVNDLWLLGIRTENEAKRFITDILALEDYKVLHKQDTAPLFDDKTITTLKIIEAKDNTCMIRWYFFLYGYMCGKRAERARRKHK